MYEKTNHRSNSKDIININENKKLFGKPISGPKNNNSTEEKFFILTKHSIRKNNKRVKKLILYIFIILLFFIIIIFIFLLILKYKHFGYFIKRYKNNKTFLLSLNQIQNKTIHNYISNSSFNITPYSSKWIVITSINNPNKYTEILISKTPKEWKIVVVGDIKTNNQSWAKFKNSNKLVYLSIKDQLKLNYSITKYTPFNSYSRKNIGYLYAIQHGAKEIYETDDDIYMFGISYLNIDFMPYTFYAENNNSLMINPYSFYGISTIWPRGFRLKDIGLKHDTKFYRFLTRRTNLNPLIFQGLLNINPDVDSIFRLTRVSNKYSMNRFFDFRLPLMYLPGNYVPINSKNSKYLYDIFPSLAIPTTLPMRISDIWRGYIMQRYAWIYNGSLFYFPPCADNKRNYKNITSDLNEEKKLFLKLDNLLNALNVEVNSEIKTPQNFLIKIIETLANEGLLGKEDIKMYNAFIYDLNSIGYNFNLEFNRKIERDPKKFLNIYSEFKYYFPRQNKVILKNNDYRNISLFQHKDSKAKYNDILLIINYNYDFLTKLNNYILELYKDYFPHIIFVYPGKIENNETYVSCPESYKGYYSYKCIKTVYELYPNKTGYLFIMDDEFLKIWELENFNFNIPWFYHFFLRKERFNDTTYISVKTLLDTKANWKIRYREYLASSRVAYSVSDIYYLPKEDISTFCNMVDDFYNRRIFLETAVITMMGIMLKPRYQIIDFCGLWKEGRNRYISYIKTAYHQATIHPIKLSNITEVNKYLFYMNGRNY